MLLLALLTVGAARGAGAQDETTRAEPAGPETQQPEEGEVLPDVSPGGAFVRSLAIPGWGHAATGSYTRAGFYFATSGATFWMLTKSLESLDAADDHLALVESELEREMERAGITNPDTVSARLNADDRVTEMRALVESREQQVEDWTAFGIFWLLLNATDAFVSAHLADFPEPVEVDVVPGIPGRPSELRFSIPVGSPGG
ncbi:MAG: DUF5683 domain-containing protein [Longimicrobiales bacterium]